jgi:septum formation protein
MSERLRAVSLASRSPRRKQLLESLRLDVRLVASAYDEQAAGGSSNAKDLALAHALGKARLADDEGPPVLIAADTVVELGGELLGKPADASEARSMLRKLAGREHRVHTGFAIVDRGSGRRHEGVESTIVQFLPLDERVIAAYVATGDPMDKAGAYGIQGAGGLLVASIAGDFYTVMGLPLARVGAALRELGYALLP